MTHVSTNALLRGTLVSVDTTREEVGWRGFAVPEGGEAEQLRVTDLISRCAWCVWHDPILILADYNAGTPDGKSSPPSPIFTLTFLLNLRQPPVQLRMVYDQQYNRSENRPKTCPLSLSVEPECAPYEAAQERSGD